MTAPDPVRAGRALRGAAAAILLLEGIAVLFVPRGIAQSGDGLTGLRLAFLLSCVLPGPQFIAYLVLWAVIPKDSRG